MPSQRFWPAFFCALATTAVGAPARAAEFTVFASPMLGYVIDANATCYLSNVGKRTVRVKGQRILDSSGAVLTPDATTCGSPEGFDLAPGATCYLGRNTTVSPLACGAFVSNSTFMRGTLEWRKAPTDASYAVGRIELTAKTSSAPVD